MSVNGWHLNGATERLDSFFESNDWYSDDKAIKSIAEILARASESGEGGEK